MGKQARQSADFMAQCRALAPSARHHGMGQTPGNLTHRGNAAIVDLLNRDALPTKEVSEQVMIRLQAAECAVAHAKNLFEDGAANQSRDLLATRYQDSEHGFASSRSRDRGRLARFDAGWSHERPAGDPFYQRVAQAELAGGGYCEEHAAVVFDYLRRTQTGQVNLVEASGHAFVIIGDVQAEDANSLVVADAWTRSPTCVCSPTMPIQRLKPFEPHKGTCTTTLLTWGRCRT